MVGERGFEPPTPWSRTRCSTRLSHSPTDCSPLARRCADFHSIALHSCSPGLRALAATIRSATSLRVATLSMLAFTATGLISGGRAIERPLLLVDEGQIVAVTSTVVRDLPAGVSVTDLGSGLI